MNEFFFNVSLHGIHLFRTDKYNDYRLISRVEKTLVEKFPRNEGYDVTKYTAPVQTWTTEEVAR